MKQDVKRRGILLVVSFALLAAALIYLAFAWYTKMTNISAMKFDVAQWDFNASHMAGDSYVNVYTYQTLTGGKAAPGTAGELPLTLTSSNSDTDITYDISIDKSTMSSEFQERIYFYYKDEDGNLVPLNKTSILSGQIPRGSTKVETIYWEWIYEFSDIKEATVSQSAEEFDAYDTKVGKDPDLYENQMNATLYVVGAEIEPVPETNAH